MRAMHIPLAKMSLFLLLSPLPISASSVESLTPIDPRAVTVGGEIGRRIQVTIHTNIFSLAIDKDFLGPFTQHSAQYIGLGKLIDATARLAHHTGNADLVSLKERLVGGAIAAQEPDGYLGTMPKEKRIWTLWDIHEMSYLVFALATDHRLFSQERSLKASARLADYLIGTWEADPPKQPSPWNITLHMGVTGIENAMLALHAQTGSAKYLDFVRRTRRLPEWDAHIAIGRWGPVEGHAYAHLCRCLSQLRLEAVVPDERLVKPSRDVMEFITHGEGMAITGAIGDHECWHDTQEGTVNLGETCASAYLIRWLDHMLRRDADFRLGDIMERTLFNGLFAAQSPDGRQIRYYTPFDGPRSYFKGDTYCCPNNYRRIIAELPGMIYYRSSKGIAVNLYTPSTAKISLDDGPDVAIRQETDYPASGKVIVRIDPSAPRRFAVRLRLPSWCDAPAVRVNGEAVSLEAGKPTAVVERDWAAGDRIELDFPMPWRLIRGRVNQAGKVAIMRGPLVYSLNPDRSPKFSGMDLHLLVLDPGSVAGVDDQRDFSGAPLCRAAAWRPGAWYPSAKPNVDLILAPFVDPDAQAVYFKVPNPHDPATQEDELFTE